MLQLSMPDPEPDVAARRSLLSTLSRAWVGAPVLLALLLLSAATAARAQDHSAMEVEIVGPSSPKEGVPGQWTVIMVRRPVATGTAGYRPTGMASPGGGALLPSHWEQTVEFSWDFGDGEGVVLTGERASISYVYEDDGEATITVEAVTEEGVVAVGTKSVTVQNRDPRSLSIAAVEIDPATALFELKADADDAQGDPLLYKWDFGDGEQAEGIDRWSVTHSYPLAGVYTVTLTVSDDDGGEASKTKEIRAVGAGGSSDTLVDPIDDSAVEGVVTQFKATLSGSFRGTFDGEVRSLAGLHLGPIDDGAKCRFMLTAWDAPQLANIILIADLPGLPDSGGARYTIGRPQVRVNIYPDVERYEAARSLILLQFKDRGFGEILAPMAGLLPAGQRQDLANAIGVDPGQREQPEARPGPAAVSPFGVSEHQSFETVGGSFDLTFVPYDRAVATFDLSLRNTDKEAPRRVLGLAGEFSMDLEAARRDGVMLYDRCGPGEFSVEEVFPEDGEQHVFSRTPRIIAWFSDEYAVETLDESMFQLTYPAAGTGEPVVVPTRFFRRGTGAFLEPIEELWGGVRYKARIRTGAEGVRGKTGVALDDEDGSGWYSWEFTTRVDIVPRAGESELLSCHVFQTVRDAPLIRGKPAVARVYADWMKRPEVAASAQVEEFTARVLIKGDAGELGSQFHTFVRPDLWESKGIRERKAEHSANLFWTPDASTPRSLRIAMEVPGKAGESHKEKYWTRCPTPLWDLAPELTFQYFVLAVNEWEEEEQRAPIEAVVLDIVSESEVFAEQVFPLKSVFSSRGGVLEASGGGSCDSACAANLLSHHGGSSSADVIVGFVPMSDALSGGHTWLRLGQDGPAVVILAVDGVPGRRDRFVNGLVHELGHTLWLEHLPTVDGEERSVLTDMRDRALANGGQPVHWYEGVEGFRIARDGRSGFNKSSVEGNGEGSWLTPLMFPGTIPFRDSFILRHQYLEVMEWLEARGGMP